MGNWKNYEELEDNLSIDELIHTLNAHRKKQKEEHVFLAALQGVDISDKEPIDITQLSPVEVAQTGFGVGLGIGHSIQNTEAMISE